jgi:flagellar assembly factor FliW
MPTTLESRRFGPVAVADEEILHFPEGLPGFEELREFLLLSPPDFAPVQFLVSLQDPEIGFPILAASLCLEKYTPAVHATELLDLGLSDPSGLAVYAVITFRHEEGQITANLRAPLFINPMARLGKQVILSDSTYTLHHRLLGG